MGIIGNFLHLSIISARDDHSDPFIHLSSFRRDRVKNPAAEQVRRSHEGYRLCMGRRRRRFSIRYQRFNDSGEDRAEHKRDLPGGFQESNK